MADFYGRKKDEKLWSDFVKPTDKQPEEQPQQAVPNYNMGAPTQVSPIVQPLVIVPYSTQMQPLYQYAPDGTLPGYDMQEDDFEETVSKKAKKEKVRSGKGKTRIMGVFTLLFSLIVLAACIIDMFIENFAYLNITDGSMLSGSNLSVIVSTVPFTVDGINSLFKTSIILPEFFAGYSAFYSSAGGAGLPVAGVISVSMLVTVITAIVVLVRSIIRIIGGKGKKDDFLAGLVMLIFSVVALALELLTAIIGGGMEIMDAVNTALLTNYGTIAFVALSLLITVFSEIGGAKSKKQ